MLLLCIFIDARYFGFVPSFVDKAATVGEESAVDGVEDGKLSQRLHGKEQHETDNHEADELENGVSSATTAMFLIDAFTYHAAGPTIVKRLTGTNEETGPDRTTCFEAWLGPAL